MQAISGHRFALALARAECFDRNINKIILYNCNGPVRESEDGQTAANAQTQKHVLAYKDVPVLENVPVSLKGL